MDIEQTLQEYSDDLLTEEKEKIYEEMNEMVINAKKNVSNFDFSVNEAKLGLKFPLTIIISLVLLLSVSIFGVWLYSMKAEQKALTIGNNEINSEALLAKILIEENKKKVEESEVKIKNIENNLQNAIEERNQLEANFENRLEKRKKELEENAAAEINDLREKLANKGTSQQEIDALLEQERKKIEKQKNQQINTFQTQLNKEKIAIALEYENQVRNLQLQQQQQTSTLNNLKSEIDKKEIELEQKVQATSRELVAAQQDINRLQQNKEERTKAIRTFDIYFRNIKKNITNGNYNQALSNIQRGNQEINNSVFAQDQLALIYLSAFDIQENIINNLIAFQEETSQNITEQTTLLNSSIAAITSQLEQSQNDLQQAQDLLEIEQKARQEEQNQRKILQNKIQDTENQKQEIQQQLNNTLQRLENASTTYSTVETNLRSSQENTLSNIENIINYINTKESGYINEDEKQAINNLIQQLPVYQQIGTILSQNITNKDTTFP